MADNRYSVKVSSRFVALSYLSSVLVAFVVGHIARVILVDRPQKEWILAHQQLYETSLVPEFSATGERILKLPTPVLPFGKVLPHTTYTSKTFNTARSSINSRWIVTEAGEKQCVNLPGNECPFTEEFHSTTNDSVVGMEDPGDEGEVHMPQGQHLLMDIENVDAAFLNSEERLANAMLSMVNECGLTLLSYHCHGLEPSGVSCAGVLLESHVSFHTWPSEGVITLDLFTCGDKSLLPIVPLVEKLFSVPRSDAAEDKPQMVWAHKYRGFSEDADEEKTDLTDFFTFPIGAMTDFKHQVWSEETDFQRFDVVDILRPHYQSMDDYKRSLLVDGSYESMHPDLFKPDRIVFLDGVMQSRRSGDAAYHEALVHPGMFVHDNPKRVAIIGGGEGATLREVLKHKTVEKVVMIEIDEKMVKLSREHLPEWSDCSMLEGNTGSCFDDPRAEIYCEDAFAWFIDRFSGGGNLTEEPFDVIIMDALDPQIQKAFVDALYDGGPFLGSLPKAIADNGLLIAQVGESNTIGAPPENIGLHRNRVNFIRSLSDLGFKVVRDYEEAHGGFSTAWQIIVASKSSRTMSRWASDSSLVEYLIRKRTKPTKAGDSPLLFFDGGTMESFGFPSKASEVVFCRRYADLPNCQSGHGFDQGRDNIPTSALDLKPSNTAVDGGRGVLATQDIPTQSYVGLEDAVHSVYVKPSSSELLKTMIGMSLVKSEFSASASLGKTVTFIDTFGRRQRKSDEAEIMAETSLHAFINERRKSTSNVGQLISAEEENHVYNPMRDRQIHLLHGAYPNTDIGIGDELLLPAADER